MTSEGEIRQLGSTSLLLRRQALAAVAADLRACEGKRYLLEPKRGQLQAAVREAASTVPGDGGRAAQLAAHAAELLEPLVAGLAWDDPVEQAVVAFGRSRLPEHLSAFANHPFAAIEALDAAIEQLLNLQGVERWMAGLDRIAPRALRSFVLHKLFRSLSSAMRAGIVRVLSEASHRKWSPRVAHTVDWYGSVDDYRIEIWPAVAEWAVSSLAAGQVAGLGPEGGVPPEPSVDGDDDSGGASVPFWWDPGRTGLLTLVRVRGMGQPSAARFLPHAFIGSPLGRVLRASGLVMLTQVLAKHVCCPGCGHSHTFLKELGCAHPCCHAVEPEHVETQWLVSPSALDRPETLEASESGGAKEMAMLAADSLIREFFERERSKALDGARGGRGSATPAGQAHAKTSRKTVQAPVYRLMVLAALAECAPAGLVGPASSLEAGWEIRFLGNLERHDDGAESVTRANRERRDLCTALQVPEVSPVGPDNFRVIKNRIKNGFLEFLENRNAEVDT